MGGALGCRLQANHAIEGRGESNGPLWSSTSLSYAKTRCVVNRIDAQNNDQRCRPELSIAHTTNSMIAAASEGGVSCPLSAIVRMQLINASGESTAHANWTRGVLQQPARLIGLALKHEGIK